MSRKIIVGILLFVIIFTIPIWYNLITKGKKPEISLDTPEIRALEKKECIEDTDYMRAYHMKLLNEWRNSVVRDGDRIYTASDGRRWEKCIQTTCLKCHSNREEFCNACHSFAGITPNCWDCHDVLETE